MNESAAAAERIDDYFIPEDGSTVDLDWILLRNSVSDERSHHSNVNNNKSLAKRQRTKAKAIRKTVSTLHGHPLKPKPDEIEN